MEPTDCTAKQRTLHFICINYHCSELVAELLDSLDAQADPDIRIILVDNSPNDPDLPPLVAGRADVEVMDVGINLGFGGGCNLALEHLQSREPDAIAWLINPDARLLPGAIATLRRCLEAPQKPALLGTRIQNSDGEIWFDRGRFDPRWGKVNQEPQTIKPINPDTEDDLIEPCDWLSGCSLVLDLAALPVPPRFDERIFLYYEDAELCLRLHQYGVTTYVTHAVLVSHHVSATMSGQLIKKYRHATFGKLYLLHRHASKKAVATNLLRFTARASLQWIRDPQQALGRALGAAQYLAWGARGLLRWEPSQGCPEAVGGSGQRRACPLFRRHTKGACGPR
jgi:N-acetylglucosaminyl-diphospho-decaprenol L-rhamnosyltransferase